MIQKELGKQFRAARREAKNSGSLRILPDSTINKYHTAIAESTAATQRTPPLHILKERRFSPPLFLVKLKAPAEHADHDAQGCSGLGGSSLRLDGGYTVFRSGRPEGRFSTGENRPGLDRKILPDCLTGTLTALPVTMLYNRRT